MTEKPWLNLLLSFVGAVLFCTVLWALMSIPEWTQR